MERKKSLTQVACICLVLVLASVLLLAPQGTAQTKTSQTKTLKIGYLLCLTGFLSVFDAAEERDLKIVAQMINEKGGLTVRGEKYNIELVGEDGKSTLDGVTAAAMMLTFDRRVKFVIGPNAFFTIAASPVFEPNKVLHVSGCCTTQPGELDSSTPYGFLGHNSTMGGCLIDVQAMKKEYPNVKKIAIVTPDDGCKQYAVPKIRKIVELNGYTVVGDIVAYPNEMVDYSPIAAKLNAIKDAEAIYHKNGIPQAGANIIKGLRQLGNTKPYLCSQLTEGNDLLGIMGTGEAATNVIAVGLAPDDPGNPPLVNEVFNRTGRKRPMFLITPNALWVLAKVIQAADSLDPAVVKAKWESMDKVDTLYGTGIMSGDQTYGIKHHAVSHPFAYQKIMNSKVSYHPWILASVIP